MPDEQTQDTPATPDDHLRELDKLATMYEKSSAYFIGSHAPSIGAQHKRRAAAIRWILAETAHAVDENVVL